MTKAKVIARNNYNNRKNNLEEQAKEDQILKGY